MRYVLSALVAAGCQLACNSRPPYHREVWVFRTTCEGGLAVKYEVDPDPESFGYKVVDVSPPEKQAHFDRLKHERYTHTLVLKNGTRCTLDAFVSVANCFGAGGNELDCKAGRRIVELLPPTLSPERMNEVTLDPSSTEDRLEPRLPGD